MINPSLREEISLQDRYLQTFFCEKSNKENNKLEAILNKNHSRVRSMIHITELGYLSARWAKEATQRKMKGGKEM